jgi:hemolysin activation/secretion protein
MKLKVPLLVYTLCILGLVFPSHPPISSAAPAAQAQAEQSFTSATQAQAGSAVAQIGPAATQIGPAATQAGSAATQAEPAVAQAEPADTQAEPAATQAEPAATQAGSAVAQIGPADTQAGSADTQAGPAVAQAGPAVAPPTQTKAEPADTQAEPAAPQADPNEEWPGMEEEATFEIKEIFVSGNTLFPEEKIKDIVKDFTGKEKMSADVEKARDRLEVFYHEAGYPTVMVNIPEQIVENGLIVLEVIESKIGNVKITGNRYFTVRDILGDLPSLKTGTVLYVPRVQEELNKVNSNPDLKVSPVLLPGNEMGVTDVELHVKDHLPLHGSIELNNRSGPDTTDLRLNGLIRYDNLWQARHSLSLQYQTSPEKTEEVQVLIGSYLLPSPWNAKNTLALYGVWSDSSTASSDDIRVIGKGQIFGARSIMALPACKTYNHNLTVGLDYKDFQETVGLGEDQSGGKTPITYLPLSFAYSASWPDSSGTMLFKSAANMAFRGAVTRQEEFDNKRYKARGNYLYMTLGLERMQKLRETLNLSLKLDGQISDQPLISNEQYSAGGAQSVRGYQESEVLGDDAIHGTIELQAAQSITKVFDLRPSLFYEAAVLWVKKPLPSQDPSASLQGLGAGVCGHLSRYNLDYRLDGAFALADTGYTDAGDNRLHFKVLLSF